MTSWGKGWHSGAVGDCSRPKKIGFYDTEDLEPGSDRNRVKEDKSVCRAWDGWGLYGQKPQGNK